MRHAALGWVLLAACDPSPRAYETSFVRRVCDRSATCGPDAFAEVYDSVSDCTRAQVALFDEADLACTAQWCTVDGEAARRCLGADFWDDCDATALPDACADVYACASDALIDCREGS